MSIDSLINLLKNTNLNSEELSSIELEKMIDTLNSLVDLVNTNEQAIPPTKKLSNVDLIDELLRKLDKSASG